MFKQASEILMVDEILSCLNRNGVNMNALTKICYKFLCSMFSKGTKPFDLIKCDVGNVIVTNMEKGKQKQKRDTHIVERSKF